MRTLRKLTLIILLFSLFSTFFAVTTFASNINMNLPQEQNVTNRENSVNSNTNSNSNSNTGSQTNSNNSINNDDIDDVDDVDDDEVLPMSNPSLDTNTVATVQSVEQFEDNTSSFDISSIINILLLAVGLVIILLAVAILIRLKR